jgi:peptidoglycan/LPS O-acetylase OafA/YrhL
VFLDGLRGVAAMAVAALHAAVIVAPDTPALENVGLAVDFFFCLSGFVVAQAYDARLSAEMTVVEFMTKRLVRLYPMILLGVLLGLGAHLYVSGHPAGVSLSLAAREVLIIPAPLDATGFTLNGPMWSLLFEIAACLGYALAVKWLPAKALPWLVAGAGVVLAIGIQIAGQVTTFGVSGITGMLCGIPRVAYPFLLGVVLQRSGLVARLPALNPVVGVAALLAALLTPLASPAYDIVTAMLVLPAIMLAGAATRVTGRAWEFVGRLSYPLYLVHWPVLLVAAKLSPFETFVTGVAGVLLSVAVAAVALIAYDEPARRWLTRLRSPAALKTA